MTELAEVNGVLSDIKVLDFSTLLPGPMATLFLAEAGADVIKIERPGRGDEMRSYEPKWGANSINFAMLNKGKKSIALDLKDADERKKLVPLILECDVVVDQYRPGVMDRLGFGYEALRELKSDIIYCAITGYGQTGPKSGVAGHDLNYIGEAGLLALGSGDSKNPVVPPALIADIAGGAYPAIVNILLALRKRDKSGQGSFLDISMAEGLFPFMYWAMANGMAAGRWPQNGDELVTGGSARYQLYPTSDGKILATAPLEEKFWATFVEAIGLDEDLRDDARDPRSTKAGIADIIASKPADYWQEIFDKADCCCSIVQTIEEAMQGEHFLERGVFDETTTNENGEKIKSLPLPIARSLRSGAGSNSAPELGEHNRELLE